MSTKRISGTPKQLAALGYPGLLRAMAVCVERPWRFSLNPGRLFWMLIAWRIRARSGARASHFMNYAGGGKYASQGPSFGAATMDDYRGCTLRHYDPPGWNQAQRDSLVADAMVRVGDPYSWKGLAAQFLRDITGDESWPERLDEEADICSEAGCELYRRQDPTYGGPGPCSKKRPGELEKWMQEQGWECVEVEVL